MRRRLSILAVAAVAAATVGAASPAKAASATHCDLLLRAPDVVQIGPGQINVYPSNVGPYANHVVAAASAYVDCIVNETVGPVVTCARTVVANRPTVTIDLQTLAITIDYSALLATQCTV